MTGRAPFRARLWLLALAVTVALAAGEGACRDLRRLWLATGNARWIWAPLDSRNPEPSAFYALKDFPLETAPERARLLIQADQEYLLWLNGRLVGSGRYQAGSPLDAYEVARYLTPGGNRLLVELRHSWGQGGLLASLEVERDGKLRPVVETDESWAIVPRDHFGLRRGWLLPKPDEIQKPRSWGLPPAGRWGSPNAPEEVPEPAPWYPQPARIPAATLDKPGDFEVHLDWGREVVGYLTLVIEPDTDRLGLLYRGPELPDPAEREADAEIVILPGSRTWRAPQPARFRHARVYGLGGVVGAYVEEVRDAARAGAVEVPRPLETGEILGVQAPPQRTPIKDAVRSRLGRLPGEEAAGTVE